MYDSGKIITGLVIAVILLTFPIWWNFGAAAPPAPDPKLSEAAKKAGFCIVPKDDMIRQHMQILDDWRNAVVRDGIRWVVVKPDQPDLRPEMVVIEELRTRMDNSIAGIQSVDLRGYFTSNRERLLSTGDGALIEMSLQNSCMTCHTSKKEFCDQCHNYTEVSPFCWDCHVEPKE